MGLLSVSQIVLAQGSVEITVERVVPNFWDVPSIKSALGGWKRCNGSLSLSPPLNLQYPRETNQLLVLTQT